METYTEFDLNESGNPTVYHKGSREMMALYGRNTNDSVKVGDRGVLVYSLGEGFELASIFLYNNTKGYQARRKLIHYGYIMKNRKGEPMYAGNRVEVIGITFSEDDWKVELKYI